MVLFRPIIGILILIAFSPLAAEPYKQLYDLKNNVKNNSDLPAWGEKNIEYINNIKEGSLNFIRVHFPKGSANPGSSPRLPLGGAQFYNELIDSDGPITLTYLIRFPSDFPMDSLNPDSSSPYTLGKLPGLYGGKGNTGNHIPTGEDGWTTRFMWCDYIEPAKQKVRGGGEVLLFAYNANKGKYGHKYGTHVGCNQWSFSADGKWHKLQQTITLNTPGIANGRIDICYDGKLVLSEKKVTFRTVPSLKINGIIFQTFFGGSGAKYAAPINTYIDFAEFKLLDNPLGICI
jgi:hypothetical protein